VSFSWLTFLVPWQPSPTVVVTIAAVAWTFARGVRRVRMPGWRQACFWLGLALIYAALHTRVDYYAEREFFVHRLQHLVLHHLGPFLIALAWPADAIRAGLPATLRARWIDPLLQSRGWRRACDVVMHPFVGPALFVGLIWIWLIPGVHFYAMLDVRLYRLMNWSVTLDGLFFWWLALDPRPSPPARLKYGWRIALLGAVIPPQIMSGALVTLAPGNLYPLYDLCGRAFAGITASQDQTLGGIILWVPGTMMSIIGVLLVLAQWFRSEERRRPEDPTTVSLR
jgi:putative membrane protein